MTKSPKGTDRLILRYLRNSWTILSTAVVVIIAGALIYAVLGLDRFFEEEPPPAASSPSLEPEPGSYSQDSITDLYAVIDIDLYEQTFNTEADQSSTDSYCYLTSFDVGDRKDEFQLRIDAFIWSNVDDASPNFEVNKTNPDEEVEIPGDWEAAVIYPQTETPRVQYFKAPDQNLYISIKVAVGTLDAATGDVVLELLTTYAEQDLDAYWA